jgi:hypothetical protein
MLTDYLRSEQCYCYPSILSFRCWKPSQVRCVPQQGTNCCDHFLRAYFRCHVLVRDIPPGNQDGSTCCSHRSTVHLWCRCCTFLPGSVRCYQTIFECHQVIFSDYLYDDRSLDIPLHYFVYLGDSVRLWHPRMLLGNGYHIYHQYICCHYLLRLDQNRSQGKLFLP